MGEKRSRQETSARGKMVCSVNVVCLQTVYFIFTMFVIRYVSISLQCTILLFSASTMVF